MNRKQVKIMGILNVTPDSFYDGGVFFDTSKAVDRAHEMIEEGADYLDIGGESSRPGAEPVSPQEQIDRICPVIEALSGRISVPISVDTTSAAVADAALHAGASIVNDISGLTFDSGMTETVSRHTAEIIIMHIQGRPKDMQDNPAYESLIDDIIQQLQNSIDAAIKAGIDPSRIIIDPGIGFGKTVEDNYVIINNLARFRELGYPVLIGLSRKSLIGKLYEKIEKDSGTPVDRLPGTIALNIVSIMHGADIIRVHDVKEHRLALDSFEMLQKVS